MAGQLRALRELLCASTKRAPAIPQHDGSTADMKHATCPLAGQPLCNPVRPRAPRATAALKQAAFARAGGCLVTDIEEGRSVKSRTDTRLVSMAHHCHANDDPSVQFVVVSNDKVRCTGAYSPHPRHEQRSMRLTHIARLRACLQRKSSAGAVCRIQSYGTLLYYRAGMCLPARRPTVVLLLHRSSVSNFDFLMHVPCRTLAASCWTARRSASSSSRRRCR
jgi:hypothetical protein